MQIKTILNRIQKHTSFVYKTAHLIEDEQNLRIEISIVPRANGKIVCSGCHQQRPGYDKLPERRFEFVPLWGIAVFFLYKMRRVQCPQCGVVVEQVPWGQGKQQLTTTYCWFLARWAKKLSWSEVAHSFNTSWSTVFRAVQAAVVWGRQNMNLQAVRSIGIDEIAWQKGHKYLTVVYQIDEGMRRLLWIGEHRKVKTLLKFFRWFGKDRTMLLKYICSDMWKPYLRVIAYKAGHCVHVLDRFHIMSNLNKAIDKVRAEEARRMKSEGYEPILKGSRWCLLKREENRTERQEEKLCELLQYNLKTVRAFLLKEDLQGLWEYVSPYWAGIFLDRWCNRVMRSRIDPIKKVAKSLRKHRALILNWFTAKGAISAAAVEGFNTKAKLTTRKAYGFSTANAVIVALYHALGDLPEPEFTHKF